MPFYASEKELVLALRSGEEAALNEIYREYWYELFLAALKRTDNEDVAKDIIQELFISVWERRETLEVEQSLLAYLHNAVKYRVINYFRFSITKERHITQMTDLISHLTVSDGETNLAFQDLEHSIEQVTNRLPAKTRLIFEMSRKQEKTTEEIASELNLSVQTVKNQLSSALKFVRKYLSYPLSILCIILS